MRPDKLSKIRFRLCCRWHECEYLSESVKDFREHVGGHLEEFDMRGGQCCWRDCEFSTEDARHFRRHVLLHCQHLRLSSVGDWLARRQQLTACLLSRAEHWLLPDVSQPFRCCWQGCQLSFEDPMSFYCHASHHFYISYKTAAEHKSLAVCEWNECGHRLATLFRARAHARTHTHEKLVCCGWCGCMFGSAAAFIQHRLRQAPAPMRRHRCSVCLKLFASRRLMLAHSSRSHAQLSQCGVCGQVMCVTELGRHMKRVHQGLSYECSICGKKFKYSSNMAAHVRQIHSNEPPEKQLHCPFSECQFSHRLACRINYHIKMKHMGYGGLYRCHLCRRAYKQSSTLSHHLRRCHPQHVPHSRTNLRYSRQQDGHYYMDEELRRLAEQQAEIARQRAIIVDGTGAHTQSGGASLPAVVRLRRVGARVSSHLATLDGRRVPLSVSVRRCLQQGVEVLARVSHDQVELVSACCALNWNWLDGASNTDGLSVATRPASSTRLSLAMDVRQAYLLGLVSAPHAPR